MAFGVVHHFAGGTKEQYEASIGAALQGRSGEAATRERAQQFGWPAIAARYDDFFSELRQ